MMTASTISTQPEQKSQHKTNDDTAGHLGHESDDVAENNQLSGALATSPSPLRELGDMLTHFASSYKLDTHAKLRIEVIIGFIKGAVANKNGASANPIGQSKVSEIRQAVRTDLEEMYRALKLCILGVQETVNATLSGVDKVLKEAKALKEVTKVLETSIGKVTEVTNKLASNSSPYCNALMASPKQISKVSADPRVLSDLEWKDKQILVDIFDKEGNNTLTKSLTELVGKANEAIRKIEDA
jgi:hypothetical protein